MLALACVNIFDGTSYKLTRAGDIISLNGRIIPTDKKEDVKKTSNPSNTKTKDDKSTSTTKQTKGN